MAGTQGIQSIGAGAGAGFQLFQMPTTSCPLMRGVERLHTRAAIGWFSLDALVQRHTRLFGDFDRCWRDMRNELAAEAASPGAIDLHARIPAWGAQVDALVDRAERIRARGTAIAGCIGPAARPYVETNRIMQSSFMQAVQVLRNLFVRCEEVAQEHKVPIMAHALGVLRERPETPPASDARGYYIAESRRELATHLLCALGLGSTEIRWRDEVLLLALPPVGTTPSIDALFGPIAWPPDPRCDIILRSCRLLLGWHLKVISANDAAGCIALDFGSSYRSGEFPHPEVLQEVLRAQRADPECSAALAKIAPHSQIDPFEWTPEEFIKAAAMCLGNWLQQGMALIGMAQMGMLRAEEEGPCQQQLNAAVAILRSVDRLLRALESTVPALTGLRDKITNRVQDFSRLQSFWDQVCAGEVPLLHRSE